MKMVKSLLLGMAAGLIACAAAQATDLPAKSPTGMKPTIINDGSRAALPIKIETIISPVGTAQRTFAETG